MLPRRGPAPSSPLFRPGPVREVRRDPEREHDRRPESNKGERDVLTRSRGAGTGMDRPPLNLSFRVAREEPEFSWDVPSLRRAIP